MSIPNLILDPNFKYWVLLPISVAMVLFGILRQSLNALLTPTPKLQQLAKLKETEYIRKAQLFKQHYWNLPKQSFESRQTYLSEILTNGSVLAEKETDSQEQVNPLTDPGASDAMMAFAKNSFGNMAAQYLMMGWVNFFFAGFVLMKLPFPLTLRFKQMLQSGVSTSDLDVRWVSAISWYFIAMLGLNSVYDLLLGDDSIASQLLQQQQQQPPPMLMGGSKQTGKILEAEANDIRIISYEHVLTNVEARLLELYDN